MTGWMSEVQSSVEARLAAFFDGERAVLTELAGESEMLVAQIEALTLRGGKRLRPAVLYAGYRSVQTDGRLIDVVDACAGLELLQSYLLIHDDWMDNDDERRGGPSVHTALGQDTGDAHLGAALAVLAGNLACAWSWRLFRDGAGQASDEALRIVTQMHEEVLVGQQLDLLAVEDVSRMHQLKTGSYTLRGPMSLGAALGGGDEAQQQALSAFATPLGEAFQIRDDLLGTFGDPGATGKPAGNDLRAGKRTSLLAAAERKLDEGAFTPIAAVFGVADARDDAVGQAIRCLEESGVREEVEGRLEALIRQAESGLDAAPLADPGTTMLRELAQRLAYRKV
ncbi:MAG: polyprenyl synthetase family protein [Sandaracinaceae bacterium]